MELWQFLGELHPKLVQFPLVLLLVGLLFDLFGSFRDSSRARWAGVACSAIGTVGLLFAFICGIYAEVWAGRAGVPHHAIEMHELVANLASWGFVILFAWRILLTEGGTEKTARSLKWLRVYACVGLVWYSLLALTAYLGGQLVFEYGAGVTGGQADRTLSMHDLNTLATRQTDDNLRYSEWMHHIFGFLTLGLAASLLAQAIWPAHRKKLAWIVPVFLLTGGIFLFFRADSDLYPDFTDLRQWRDREVQLHKVIALTMSAVGGIGLWRLRGRKGPETNTASDDEGRLNSKLVAVMALIGGSMLFTHVHTVAPYANVAAGVYISHVIMGFVALAVGATRLAQEYLPRWRSALSIAFGALMMVEAGLLITYNEGLPWFIGYGTYNRWAVKTPENKSPEIDRMERQFTVAPFGNFRALLNVNQKDGRLFVAFRKSIATPPNKDNSFPDDSVTLTLDAPPQLLITHGMGELALPMVKNVPEGTQPEPGKELTGSNFRTQSDFIKTTPYIGARLVLSINGKRHVGYFDPWVTERVVPVPPNELARYACPMHEGVRSKDEGSCAVCNMPLVEIRPPLPPGHLHDERYALDVTMVDGDKLKPLSTMLQMRLKDAGKPAAIATMHGQPIHLLVVSSDLNYFDHVHPTEVSKAGTDERIFELHYTFPREGTYYLYADVTPKGDRAQYFKRTLSVKAEGVTMPERSEAPPPRLYPDLGSKFVTPIPAPRTPQESAALDLLAKPAARSPLIATAAGPGVPPSARPFDPVLVELVAEPRTLYAGLHSQLAFRFSDAQGRPITDLSPYLEARGHCMIISEDTNLFVHSHPEDVMGTPSDWRGGPSVAFGTEFPRPGRYRVWGQFLRGDQLIVATFVVEVKKPLIPTGLLRFLLND